MAESVLTLRCKKTRHTLTWRQRLGVLASGVVYVYATGVKQHASIVVSHRDADLIRVSLLKVGWRIVKCVVLAYSVDRNGRVAHWGWLASLAMSGALAVVSHFAALP